MSETFENIVLWLSFIFSIITIVLNEMNSKGFLKETKAFRIMRIVLYLLLGVLFIILATIGQLCLIIIFNIILGIIWLVLAYQEIRYLVVR